MAKRMISTDVTEEDYRTEPGLRPQKLSDYIGQEKAKNTLKIFIEAARQRHDSLELLRHSRKHLQPSLLPGKQP